MVELCLTRLEKISWNKKSSKKISCYRLPASAPANITGHQDRMFSHCGNVMAGRHPAKSDARRRKPLIRPGHRCTSCVAEIPQARTRSVFLATLNTQLLNFSRNGIATNTQTYRGIVLAAVGMSERSFDERRFKLSAECIHDFRLAG